jgi:hypothetical protein
MALATAALPGAIWSDTGELAAGCSATDGSADGAGAGLNFAFNLRNAKGGLSEFRYYRLTETAGLSYGGWNGSGFVVRRLHGAGNRQPCLCGFHPVNYNADPAETLAKQTMEPKRHEDAKSLLAVPPRVVNVGLELFAVDLAGHDAKGVGKQVLGDPVAGAKVIHVQWSPPAGGNAYLAGLLGKLRS